MDGSTQHIGSVAARTGLSLRTVRYYEEVGLVRPSGRSEGGFRLYTEVDVRRLLLVRALRPAELSTEELAELLALHDRVVGAEAGASDLADARGRLADLVEVATERLRLKRERLIAAEVAVDLLGVSAQPRSEISA